MLAVEFVSGDSLAGWSIVMLFVAIVVGKFYERTCCNLDSMAHFLDA